MTKVSQISHRMRAKPLGVSLSELCPLSLSLILVSLLSLCLWKLLASIFLCRKLLHIIYVAKYNLWHQSVLLNTLI